MSASYVYDDSRVTWLEVARSYRNNFDQEKGYFIGIIKFIIGPTRFLAKHLRVWGTVFASIGMICDDLLDAVPFIDWVTIGDNFLLGDMAVSTVIFCIYSFLRITWIYHKVRHQQKLEQRYAYR